MENKGLCVKVKRLRDNVTMPFYATSGSAGLDLSADIDGAVTIKKGEIKMIPTGLAISIPTNEIGAFVFARSGLAAKHGICLANSVGVVDSDYRGEIKCALINLGDKDFTIEKGDRIAQLVFMPVAIASLKETDTLDETERGAGGFGSTGVKK